MSTITLKPCTLVSLHTRMEGGVKYTRIDLDAKDETKIDAESKIEKWETTKVVADPQEHARATKVRGRCGSIIRSICSHSAFGLLCPASSEKALDEAIAEARTMVDTFNASATTVRVSVYVLKGTIAGSDEEAIRAVSSELRELMTEMREGVDQADVAKIREAANRAKKLGGMLDESTGKKVSAAIEEARSAAKAIVKRVEAGGESAALVVQELSRKALDEARFAFLDLDMPKPSSDGEGGAPLPVVETRGLDLDATETPKPDPDDGEDTKAPKVTHESRQLDLGVV